MTPSPSNKTHESEVNARFDLLHTRFKPEIQTDDYRLLALVSSLGDLKNLRILDLGCGQGRFASRLESLGARVVGLDLSAAMLSHAPALNRVRASARRLPFPSRSFDAVVAVEVFEHLAAIDEVLGEIARVLRPEGKVAIIDKNAGSWNAIRPWLPNLAVKWIDERRGLWMYPGDSPVRERWFWPDAFRRRLSRQFQHVRVEHLLSSSEEDAALFRHLPYTRLMTLWTALAPGVPS